MRVLFLAPGNSVHSRHWISSALNIKDLQVAWLSMHGAPSEPVSCAFEQVGILRAIFKIFACNDIIHVHYVSRSLIPFLFCFNKRLLLNFWGSDFERIKKFRLFWLLRIIKIMHPKVQFLTDARHISKSLLRNGFSSHIVMFGRDPSVFFADMQVPREKIIVSCRNFAPLYQVERVVEEFAASSATESGFKLVVFGSGTDLESQSIATLCRKHHDGGASIEYVGRLSQGEIASLYRRAMFVVSAALRDGGLSAAVSEGMMCGCIPIVSDAVDNAFWVSPDNGFIFDPNSKGALEQIFSALGGLSTNILSQMRNKSIQIIMKNNNIEVETKKCIDIYQSLL